MGKGDSGTPTKAAKSSFAQDPPPAPASYVEWAAAFQAYYNGATPAAGYFPPALAPGQPHPYMWAGQPLLPPYGGAPPFAAMYPPGYPYAHPSMPQGPHPYPTMTPPGRAREATTATATTDQGDYKSSDGKECSSMKQSKGSASNFGRLQSRGQDDSKNTPTSTNALQSQSAESCSDACSDDSEEDNRQDMLEKKSRKQPPEVGTPTNQIVAASSTLMERPIGVAPATTLDVGFDYWNDATSGAATVGKGKKNPAVTQALLPTFPINPLFGIAGREGATSDFWLQDDRELKRQRRKQSNRESARRSRLRKQAECEDLGTKVDTLTAENMALRSEINRLAEERNKLSTENSTLLEQLRKDRDEGSSTAKMLEGNLQTLCSIQDNGKIRDTPDADAQILRHIREEKQGQPAEQV